MANTLNVGNGDWATKENSLLGYNSENGNYKPLPFDFTRASNGTFVNKSGLIETAANGVPRIDFLGNTSGALLLEPQRTNLITYSEDFSNAYWTKAGSSVVSGFTSPDGGLNAFKLVEDTSTGGHNFRKNSLAVTLTNTYTFSIIAKKGERDWIMLRDDLHAGVSTTYFDLTNGVVGTTNSAYSNIEALGNGFYRCSTSTISSHASSTIYPATHLAEADNDVTYTGDGTSGVYIYGAQLEQGSYSTSLINTQGSAVTRVADACNNGGNDQVINSTEGVLYVELSSNSTATFKNMSINSNGSNRINFFIYNSAVTVNFDVGGVNQASISYTIPSVTSFNKFAFSYKLNEFKLFVNGTQRGSTDTSGIVPPINTFNKFSFNDSFGNNFYGNVKDLQVFTTALTDAELAALTTI